MSRCELSQRCQWARRVRVPANTYRRAVKIVAETIATGGTATDQKILLAKDTSGLRHNRCNA